VYLIILLTVSLLACSSDKRGNTYKMSEGNAARNHYYDIDGPTDIKGLTIIKIDSLLVTKGISGTPVFYDNSDLVVTSNNGKIVYLKEGEMDWVFTVDSTAPSISPPASDSAGNIFFGAGSNLVYSITGRGKLNWKCELESAPNQSTSAQAQYITSPLIYGGCLYVGTSTGWLYCLTLDGKMKWKFRTNNPVMSPIALTKDERLIAVASNFEFSKTDTIFCLDMEGNLLWKTPVPNARLYEGPAVDDWGNTIVAGSVDAQSGREHHIYSISSNGSLNWSCKLDVVIHGIAIDQSRNIYVSGFVMNATETYSKLTCLNDSGKVKWETKLDALMRYPAIITRNGYLYVYANNPFLDQEVRRAVYIFNTEGNWIDSHNMSSEKLLDFAPVLNAKKEIAFVSRADGAVYIFSSPAWSLDFLGGGGEQKKE